MDIETVKAFLKQAATSNSYKTESPTLRIKQYVDYYWFQKGIISGSGNLITITQSEPLGPGSIPESAFNALRRGEDNDIVSKYVAYSKSLIDTKQEFYDTVSKKLAEGWKPLGQLKTEHKVGPFKVEYETNSIQLYKEGPLKNAKKGGNKTRRSKR